MDLKLNGKRALVTGSSSGLGEAIAARLAAEGAKVIVHGRNRERAEGVAQKIRDAGGEASVAIGDLASDEAAQGVVDQALAAYDGLDIVINNAGGFQAGDWESATTDRWAEVYDQNVLSMVRVIRGTLESVKSGGWGRYVQLGSAVGASPFAGVPDYNVTKAANINMSVSLSKALAGTGVTSNTVSPGPIRTPALEQFFADFAKGMGIEGSFEEIEGPITEAAFGHQPTKRVGRPEEIADTVAFIASPLADYINGANIRVDGGHVPAVN